MTHVNKCKKKSLQLATSLIIFLDIFVLIQIFDFNCSIWKYRDGVDGSLNPSQWIYEKHVYILFILFCYMCWNYEVGVITTISQPYTIIYLSSIIGPEDSKSRPLSVRWSDRILTLFLLILWHVVCHYLCKTTW